MVNYSIQIKVCNMAIITEDLRKLINLIAETTNVDPDIPDDDTDDIPDDETDDIPDDKTEKSKETPPKKVEVKPDQVSNNGKPLVTNPEELLVHKHDPIKFEGSVDPNKIARALGIKNTRLFTQAFNKLSHLPSRKDIRLTLTKNEMAEISFAFFSLLSANSTTTSSVISHLRQLHRHKKEK